jgi:hypothetical protein
MRRIDGCNPVNCEGWEPGTTAGYVAAACVAAACVVIGAVDRGALGSGVNSCECRGLPRNYMTRSNS